MGKTGRNEPCPCGSGKKHKRCCWEQTHSPALRRLAERAMARQTQAMEPGAHPTRPDLMSAEDQERAAHGVGPVRPRNPLVLQHMLTMVGLLRG